MYIWKRSGSQYLNIFVNETTLPASAANLATGPGTSLCVSPHSHFRMEVRISYASHGWIRWAREHVHHLYPRCDTLTWTTKTLGVTAVRHRSDANLRIDPQPTKKRWGLPPSDILYNISFFFKYINFHLLCPSVPFVFNDISRNCSVKYYTCRQLCTKHQICSRSSFSEAISAAAKNTC